MIGHQSIKMLIVLNKIRADGNLLSLKNIQNEKLLLPF